MGICRKDVGPFGSFDKKVEQIKLRLVLFITVD